MQTSPARLSIILSIPELKKIWETPGRGIAKEYYQMSGEEQQENHAKNAWIEARQAKKNNLNAYANASGIPKIFQNISNKYSPKNDEISNSLFVSGGFGTGKTYLTVGLLRYYINRLPCQNFVEPFKNLPIFITVPELLMKIRSCFSLNKCEETIVDKYSDCPLLILDDLGAEKTTEWVLQTLYIILNNRYSNLKRTIITSNLSLDELRDKIGDRIASRIAGMCKIVKLTGKDRRVCNERNTINTR